MSFLQCSLLCQLIIYSCIVILLKVIIILPVKQEYKFIMQELNDLCFCKSNRFHQNILFQLHLYFYMIEIYINSIDRNFHQMSTQEILAKFVAFVEYHEIKYDQIWVSSPCLTVNQFSQIMKEKFGYQFIKQEVQTLSQLSSKNCNLFVQCFHSLGLWKSNSYNSCYGKLKKIDQQKLRPQTAKQVISNVNKMGLESKLTQNSDELALCKSSANQNSKSRFKQTNDLLQKKIIQNALDKKWQYLIKVGEMNTWQKSVKITERLSTKKQLNLIAEPEPKLKKKMYKIEGSDQNLQIIEEKQNGCQQILPLKVFDQKYQLMKKKCVAEQKSKNNMKGTMLLVLDKKDKVSKSKLCQKISQRDQQLNYLLLQIIRLKQIFGQQEQILTQYGVNN